MSARVREDPAGREVRVAREVLADVLGCLRAHGVPCIRPAPFPVVRVGLAALADVPVSVGLVLALAAALADAPALAARVREVPEGFCLLALRRLRPDVPPDAHRSAVEATSATRSPKKAR